MPHETQNLSDGEPIYDGIELFTDTLGIIDSKITRNGERPTPELLKDRALLKAEVDSLSNPEYPNDIAGTQHISQISQSLVELYNHEGLVKSMTEFSILLSKDKPKKN